MAEGKEDNVKDHGAVWGLRRGERGNNDGGDGQSHDRGLLGLADEQVQGPQGEGDLGDDFEGVILWTALELEEDSGRVWKRTVWKRTVVVSG